MKILLPIVLFVALLPDAAVAQETDASIDAGYVVDAGEVDAGAGIALPAVPLNIGGVAAPLPPLSIDEPITTAKGFYAAAKSGQWAIAFACLLVAFIAFLRTGGKWLHDKIPDDTKHWFLAPLERVLFFIFDTKIGGWILNWLTSISMVFITAYEAKLPIDAGLWKTALMASTGATALVELAKDIKEWWDKKQAEKAAAAKPAEKAPETK